jgi:diadenosine tetraphosphate (Ap4A) HIT family hydrolase
LIVGVPWRRRFAKETRMFVLDPQLHRDCVIVGRFPLSLLLLSRDANYPWFILVPQRPGITELYQLSLEDRARLLDESCQLSEVLMDVFSGDKLNVAALGNVVAQLHVHHIVRHRGDRAWPRPVWGAVPAAEYSERAMADLLDNLLPMLAGKDFEVLLGRGH